MWEFMLEIRYKFMFRFYSFYIFPYHEVPGLMKEKKIVKLIFIYQMLVGCSLTLDLRTVSFPNIVNSGLILP